MKRKHYSLYGRLLSKEALYEGYKQVKRAKGAAGLDGQSLSEFGARLDDELSRLLLELKEKRYQQGYEIIDTVGQTTTALHTT